MYDFLLFESENFIDMKNHLFETKQIDIINKSLIILSKSDGRPGTQIVYPNFLNIAFSFVRGRDTHRD